MLRNYFKIAWRNLWKNKIFSSINIAGLSAGIAFSLLIGAYVWNELQVNKRLKNAGNQYFLQSQWKDPNMGNAITTVGPLAKRLKEVYPNLVANYYRWDGITSIVSKGEKHFRENIQLGDSTILSMYGFSLLYGNAATALSEPFSVVLTRQTAVKYFGKTDVVGQTMEIQSFSGGNHEFMITGVLDNIPENSVTQLNAANHNNLFIPTNTYTYFGRNDFESWGNIYVPSYIETRPGVTAKDLAGPIASLIQKNAPDGIKENLDIRTIALTDYYLDNNNGLARRMLYTLSLIGLFILMMAIVNFINIAISSSGTRTKEIGVRKVMGSLRSQLVVQFLAESFILVSFSMLLALVCYPLVKSSFAALIGKEIPSLGFFPWSFVFIPLVLVMLIAMLAGLYPAFVLSSLKTVDSLKGKLATVNENIWLRKSLVGFQFFIALVVLIAATVVTQQINQFFGKSLGYNKEYIVSSQAPRDWSPKGVRKMETIRNEFSSLPQVTDVALSYEIPNGMTGGQPSVYLPGGDSSAAVAMQAMNTDEHYLAVYQVPLAAGSFFDGHGMDSAKVVLNEQAVLALKFINPADAVGRQLRIPGDPTVFTIKGVTKDFQIGSMQQKLPPVVIFNVEFAVLYRYLSFRVKPGNVTAAIKSIQNKWAQLLPGSSFEYRFMDDTLKELYATEIQLRKAAYASTILSLVIMLLGVLGLISLSMQKRVKEMGIRKVLGASVTNLVLLFVNEFMVIIVLAAAAAIPVAGMLMTKWLNNYAYRITLSAKPFVLAVIIITAVTLVLICLQTIKAALANPVKSLRNE